MTGWPEIIVVSYATTHLKGSAVELRSLWDNQPYTMHELYERLRARFAADAQKFASIQFFMNAKKLSTSQQWIEDCVKIQKLAIAAKIPDAAAIPILMVNLPLSIRAIIASHSFANRDNLFLILCNCTNCDGNSPIISNNVAEISLVSEMKQDEGIDPSVKRI